MYTFEQLKEDVRKEAEALKVHATKEERERLDIEMLNPNQITKCVYGLATGSCMSERAIELITKCAPVYYTTRLINNIEVVHSYNDSRWSPIEVYIQQDEANNANLIAFLRGETETLEL
jgi:hypothetical protein